MIAKGMGGIPKRGMLVAWLICLCVSLVYGYLPQRASAAPEGLELQIQAGYDGKVKEGKWFPAVFTLKNTSNEELSGELAVQMADSSGGRDTTYVQRVELPPGSTKTVWMTLPGMMLNSKNNSVTFYRNSMDHGEKIPFAAGRNYIETTSARKLQIGVLARDPDTFNFITLLNAKGYDIGVVSLHAESMPNDPLMLDSLDAIVMNDIASDTLRTDQIKAVTDWVARGGTLVLAGGAGYAKTAKAFEAISPVTAEGTATLDRLSSLEAAAGKALTLNRPLTVAKASVRSGEVMYKEGDIPVMVRKPAGEGFVWYAAYDLAEQPLASWNGNTDVWAKLLNDRMAGAPMNAGFAYPSNRPLWDLQYVLDYFPSIQPPSFSLLLSLFLVYVVVVAPLLYLILKMLDKREWAWVIIPAVSVLSSIGIFIAGAADKTSVLTHTLNVVQLDGEGQGHRASATAVFVPSGGKHQLELPAGTQVRPLGYNDYYSPAGGTELDGSSEQVVFQEPDQTKVQWRNVPFWSVRKAMLEYNASEAAGHFTVKAAASGNGMISGEVRNETQADLYGAAVIINQQVHTLGDLKKGESKPFSLTAVSYTYQGYQDYGYLVFPQYGNSLDVHYRERQMLNTYMNQKGRSLSAEPIVIGWSKDNESSYTVNGKSARSDRLNLWTQTFELELVQGDRIVIPGGYLTPSITDSTINNYSTEYNGTIHIGQGELTLEYTLPQIDGATYETMKLNSSLGTQSMMTWQIWNGGQQQWQDINLQVSAQFDENLQDYIIGNRTVRLKAAASQDTMFRFPALTLEGTVKP